jgi:C4-dicarboxylate transporter DctM subunit
MGITLLISGIVFMAIGVPVAFALGLAGFIGLLWETNLPITVVAQRIMVNIDSFPLMAIPFFILAGEMMSRGGASRRLVDFAAALVGHLRAGLGMVSIIASAIFAGISGSAAADTAAIGTIIIPSMVERGYNRGWVAALQACAGALGPIIPPSLVMIIYGSLTGISISQLFLGGIVPGLLIVVALMLVTAIYAKRFKMERGISFSWLRLKDAATSAIWSLILPVIILGGILAGVFTATEAGVVATAYAMFIGLYIYKEMGWKDLPKIFVDATASTAMILLIVGTASICAWLLAVTAVPQKIVVFLTSVSNNPTVILTLIIAFLLLLGCVVETVAAAIIMIPILFPISQQLGYDPIHFGVVVVIALVFAGITPPVGVLLFITSGIAKAPFVETCKYLIPYAVIMVGTLYLCAYVPILVTLVPTMFL